MYVFEGLGGGVVLPSGDKTCVLVGWGGVGWGEGKGDRVG